MMFPPMVCTDGGTFYLLCFVTVLAAVLAGLLVTRK